MMSVLQENSVASTLKGFCRCCHGIGTHLSLYTSFKCLNIAGVDYEETTYFKQLLDCFNIEIIELKNATHLSTICFRCRNLLSNAMQFKQQVLTCEMEFRKMYSTEKDIKEDIEILAAKSTTKETIVEKSLNRQKTKLQETEINENNENENKNVFEEIVSDLPDEDPVIKVEILGSQDIEIKEETEFYAVDAAGHIINIPVDEVINGDEQNYEEEQNKEDNDDDDNRNGESKKNIKRQKTKFKAKKKMVTDDSDYRVDSDEEYSDVSEDDPKRMKKRKKNNPSDDSDSEFEIPLNKMKKEKSEEEMSAAMIKATRVGEKIRPGIHFKEIKGRFRCLECRHTCKTLGAIKKHITTNHLKNDRFRCTVCYDHFQTFAQIVKHKLDVHNIDDRLKCNGCDKLYIDKSSLISHVQRYHKLGTLYECPDCDFQTFFRFSFSRHKELHSKVKKYKCQYCKKAFQTARYKVRHEMIHTGDKRQVCKLCGLAYIDRTSLKYHMRRIHPGAPF